MSNFTKSIVYSGVVLAVGLIAIFTIRSNMVGQGSDFATMEPAAGSEVGASIAEGMEGITTSIEQTAAEATTETTVETTTVETTTEPTTSGDVAVETTTETTVETTTEPTSGEAAEKETTETVAE